MKIQYNGYNSKSIQICDGDLSFGDYIIYTNELYVNRYSMSSYILIGIFGTFNSIKTIDRELRFEPFFTTNYKELNNYIL